ncbi:MAG TPA: MoaD/ThiS family protein [Candidatus Baltobacteraceae bacterium]|jgi:molybdopterin converting factor small subunit
MTVSVVAFARLRELLGFSQRSVALPDAATVDDAWSAIATGTPAVAALRASTRIACNGAIARGDRALHDGDELSLLPPAGGG